MTNIFIGMETSGALRRRFQDRGHCAISVDRLPAEDVANGVLRFGGHWQGDVLGTFALLQGQGWSFAAAVFHPDCTHLTNSAAWAFKDPDFKRYPGVGYHQRVKPGTLTGSARRAAREMQLAEVRKLDALPVKIKLFENPIGAITQAFPADRTRQIVQPFELGDDASKATQLIWDGVPAITLPTPNPKYFPPRMVCQGCGRTWRYMEQPAECDACAYQTRQELGKVFPILPRWSNQTDSGQNKLGVYDDRWKDRSRTYPGIAGAIVNHICKHIGDA